MPRRSARQKFKVPLREASTRQRRLTKKQALLDQLSYDPQVNTHQQGEDEQSQNEYHSSPFSSTPCSQQRPFDMLNHGHPQDEDINIDQTSDSSGTEIFDMRQHHDQDASHTVSEHASVSLLVVSPARTPSPIPLVRSASLSPSPAPAPAPPSQPPAAKGTRRYKKSSRAKKAAPKQAKKSVLKRTTNKRKGKEPVDRATIRQNRVKWAESTVTVNNNHDDHDGDHDDDHYGDFGDSCGVGHNENEDEDEDEGEGEDNAMDHSLDLEMPMPMPMPHPHFLHHHMVPPLPLHLVPGPDPYLHSRVAYHNLRAARDVLYFQYNSAAREAVAAGEPWGFLWFNSDWMEQSAASVLVEFKRLPLALMPAAVPGLVPVAPMHPVVVPHSYSQPERHAHRDGRAECYY